MQQPPGQPPQWQPQGYPPPQPPPKQGMSGARIAFNLVGGAILLVGLIVGILIYAGSRSQPSTGNGTGGGSGGGVGAGVVQVVEQAVQQAVITPVAAGYFGSHGPQILVCFHPTGKFGRTGPVTAEGPESASGTIYWSGGLLGKEYVSTVRLHMSPTGNEPVIAELVNETAVIPAVVRSCTLPR